MQAREASHIDEFPENATNYLAYYRYYTSVEFDLGDERVVVAEIEPNNNVPRAAYFATILGVFEGPDKRRAGSFYDLAEAHEIISDLRGRVNEMTHILVVDGEYARSLDEARLKDAS